MNDTSQHNTEIELEEQRRLVAAANKIVADQSMALWKAYNLVREALTHEQPGGHPRPRIYQILTDALNILAGADVGSEPTLARVIAKQSAVLAKIHSILSKIQCQVAGYNDGAPLKGLVEDALKVISPGDKVGDVAARVDEAWGYDVNTLVKAVRSWADLEQQLTEATHPAEAVRSQGSWADLERQLAEATVRGNRLEKQCANYREAEHRLSDAYLRLRKLIPGALEVINKTRDELWSYVESCLRTAMDPQVCRLQFPDGSVPGNAAEAAEGWKMFYDERAKRILDLEGTIFPDKYMRPGINFALYKLSEECGELVAALSKTGRWGWDSHDPAVLPNKRETNATWVRREMQDVRGAIAYLERELNLYEGQAR